MSPTGGVVPKGGNVVEGLGAVTSGDEAILKKFGIIRKELTRKVQDLVDLSRKLKT
jgi:hypothetical protein